MGERVILVDSAFADFYNFKTIAKEWDLDFILTSNHGFRADLHYSQINNCIFGHARFDCQLHQLGGAPEHMRTFVVPAMDTVHYSWRHHQIKGNTLQLFPENGELFSISNATFNCYVISFPISHFNQVLLQLGLDPYKSLYLKEQVWDVDAVTINKLRRLCQLYKNGFQDSQSILLKTIINSFIPSRLNRISKGSRRRECIDLCYDYIQAHRTEVIRMKHLVEALGKSERSIQYIFKKEMNLSPSKFIKSIKLHNAYLDLVEKPNLTVTDIAYKNGFTHLSQFSLDFNNKFKFKPNQRKSGRWT